MARVDSKWERVLKTSRPINWSDEIEFSVLSRLPVKSILRFKTACKKWCTLFQEPQFIETHLNRSIQPSDGRYIVHMGNYSNWHGLSLYSPRAVFSLHKEFLEKICELHFDKSEPSHRYGIVASVNGILCITSEIDSPEYTNGKNIYLWNPAIRELRLLPEFPVQPFTLSCLGFGFDSKNNDYKVVEMVAVKKRTQVRVFLSRTNCWRSVSEVEVYYLYPDYAVYMNGRLHWSAAVKKDARIDSLIVSFDVSEERIIEMDFPVVCSNDLAFLHESPQSLGKSLICLCKSGEGSEIWYMKDYGDSRSWYKLYYFPPIQTLGNLVYNHCFFLENGKVVMKYSGSEKGILYDPKSWGYEILDFDGAAEVCKYSESLVSVGNRW